MCDRVQDTDSGSPTFEILLEYLKYSRGCDLTGYRRSTLMRRFQHRMQTLGIDTYENYFQYLQTHPEEHLDLLKVVFINFTGFFRDRDAWAYLASVITPQIMANKQPNEPIRVWSAGCATGQEVYTLLMLLAEEMGMELCLQRVQCYATDADSDALQQAQQGIYRDSEIGGIPASLLDTYFERTDEGYVFDAALRSRVQFKRHDLLYDPPPPEIDLLICRNVLMYFTPSTQESILTYFHMALQQSGVLFLGQAEMLIHYKHLFMPVDLKQRIYSKESPLEWDVNCAIAPARSREQDAYLLPI